MGDLTSSRGDRCAGNSSDTYYYTAGGYTGVAYTNIVDKGAFASDGNSTDVGDLQASKLGMAGISSTASGYWAGGSTGSNTNVIGKNSFSSDGNATDVGDLTTSRHTCAGAQY